MPSQVGDVRLDLSAAQPEGNRPSGRLSLFEGAPLSSEPGLGALTVPGYLADVTRRYPGREAVVFHDPDGSVVRWTFEELYERTSEIARSLILDGLPKGGIAAVLMTNRPEWLAAVFGILLAGGTAVPLSTFSTKSELAYLLQASCASVLFFEGRLLQKDFLEALLELEPAIAHTASGRLISAEFPYLQRLIKIDDREPHGAVQGWADFAASGRGLDQEVVAGRAEKISPSDPAMIFFSSGSTGTPKGIINSQRGVAVQLWRWGQFLGLPHDGTVRGWGANGFFWSGAFVQAVGAVFSCGGTLVLQPTFDTEEALSLFERERVTYLTCWPHQYARLADAPNYQQTDLSSLRYITRGTAFETHPKVRTDWIEPVCSYGSTETFTINCAIPHSASQGDCGESHGPPLPGNTVKVVEPTTGETLPLGKSGEIAVKGPTLMLGYVGVPNDEAFDEEGFFHTGDGGFFDQEGRLHFEGRLTDMIKTGGANVSPREIDAILSTLPGVKACHTVGIPHKEMGEMIVSCVVAHDGPNPDEKALRDQLKSRLASYKVPRRVLLVQEHELTFTGSAKVRMAALREFATQRLAEL